MDMVYFVIC